MLLWHISSFTMQAHVHTQMDSTHDSSPVVLNPSCLHVTMASFMLHPSSHTVPQPPPRQISTLPSYRVEPPRSLTEPSSHWGPGKHFVYSHRWPLHSLPPQKHFVYSHRRWTTSQPAHWVLHTGNLKNILFTHIKDVGSVSKNNYILLARAVDQLTKKTIIVMRTLLITKIT